MVVSRPTEDFECERLVIWLNSNVPLWTHPPNGGFRNAREGAKFKRLGVHAGVPDYLIFTPAPNEPWHRGVALEMKRKGYVPSDLKPRQSKWLSDLSGAGWLSLVGGGFEDARGKLIALGYGG